MAVETSASSGGYSAWALGVAAGSGALAGLLLGVRLARRDGKDWRVPRLNLRSRGDGSGDSTPAATPRSVSRTDSARGSGLRMLLLVRTDVPLSRAELAEQAARCVLGQFKKQHKRRDPNLRAWEEGGHRMTVLGCSSQNDMLVHQAAARTLTLPTHTFASMSKEEGRGQRSIMAVGPAPAEQLEQVALNLNELA